MSEQTLGGRAKRLRDILPRLTAGEADIVREAASALSAAEERIAQITDYRKSKNHAYIVEATKDWPHLSGCFSLGPDGHGCDCGTDSMKETLLIMADRADHAEARLSLADKMAEAVEDVLRWDSAEAEPCWRCGGGGAYCEERLGALETCRCCEGRGSHCLVVQSKDGTVACVEHFPKKRGAECQSEPELYAALAAYRASEEP